MNDLLKSLLPGAATLLGGPVAGLAVGWLANKLGVDPANTTAVTDAIQGIDPLKKQELENEFIEWGIQQQNTMILAQMADVADARKRDTSFQAAGGHNYRADAMTFAAFALIAVMVWIIWQTPELNEYIKGTLTFMLGKFTGFLDNIYNFEFGSTRASKTKDDTINTLTKS